MGLLPYMAFSDIFSPDNCVCLCKYASLHTNVGSYVQVLGVQHGEQSAFAMGYSFTSMLRYLFSPWRQAPPASAVVLERPPPALQEVVLRNNNLSCSKATVTLLLYAAPSSESMFPALASIFGLLCQADSNHTSSLTAYTDTHDMNAQSQSSPAMRKSERSTKASRSTCMAFPARFPSCRGLSDVATTSSSLTPWSCTAS